MQMTLFDGSNPFYFTKPIRLIEFFAGYGSQALALKELGVNFQHWKICEWAVKSIQAYKDMHFQHDNKDYSVSYKLDDLIKKLHKLGISSNYNDPMSLEQIKRLGENKIRTIYNNIIATHNMVNISQVKGKDLEIENTDKYDYVLTYSFPCQDLSKAGKQKGMGRDSGTRSGLLWEVERILDECAQGGGVPRILLMENVPDVIGTKNISNFADWLAKLESLGYKCYWQVLNSKNYGIPQNRERCFMVSVLGDYYYQFPEKIKLEKRLKDLLEEKVDEKYYLSERALQGAINTNFSCSKLENKLPKDGIIPTICARDYKDPKLVEITRGQAQGNRVYDPNGLSVSLCANGGGLGAKTGLYIESKVLVKEATKKGYAEAIEGDSINLEQPNSKTRRGRVGHQMAQTLTTSCNQAVFNPYYKDNLRIRKLTQNECFRLMGVRDKDFHRVAQNQSGASLYHLAGDSIVVSVLVAIFGQMISNFDFNYYIESFYNEIKIKEK